jgi:hypothetical protein
VVCFALGVEALTVCFSFDDLMSILRREDVIIKAKACLDKLCFLSNVVYGACAVNFKPNCGIQFRARVFLSAYLIRFYPGKVFCFVGEPELALIKSTKCLLDRFEEIVAIIMGSKSFYKVSAGLAQRFSLQLKTFFSDYLAWDKTTKNPSNTRIRTVLISLYLAYFSHPRDNLRFISSIFNQIRDLRLKLLNVFGKASLDALDEDLKQGIFGMPPIVQDQLEALCSTPSFFVIAGLDQIQLVHELVLDVNFRNTETTFLECPLHILMTSNKDTGSHWNEALIEMISSPPVYVSLRRALSEFRGRIMNIVVGDSQTEWLDKSINIRPDAGWVECVETVREIGKVIRRLQMPVRDRETDQQFESFETIESPFKMTDAFKIIHDRLTILERDTRNMRILLVSNVLHVNGVVYIQSNFQKMLDSGLLTMERTRSWIAAATKECISSNCISMEEVSPMSARAVTKILHKGLERLLFSETLLHNEHDFPETYLLDIWRLASLQRKFRVDAAALATVSYLKGMSNSLLESVTQIFMTTKYGERVSRGLL